MLPAEIPLVGQRKRTLSYGASGVKSAVHDLVAVLIDR